MISGLQERLGDAIFAVTAGPSGPQARERIHGRPGPRWFDATSPIARVHGDASMYVGGLRALLLQTLHPAAMTAVAEHSGYRGDMLGRLARTSQFLAITTFGHADDAETAVAAVRSIHDRVVGTMPDGSAYAATDPHLLRWVHVAEVDSFLRAHQVYGRRPLAADERDEYVAQTAVVARKLGAVDPPTTEAELAATDHAREAVHYVLLRPPLPIPVRPAYGVLAAAAVGLMPRWSRRPLRLPWLPVTERTVVRVLGSAATGTIRWALVPGQRSANELRDAGVSLT